MADIQSSQPHFMNEETEKANPYVYISPVVFTKAFLGYL